MITGNWLRIGETLPPRVTRRLGAGGIGFDFAFCSSAVPGRRSWPPPTTGRCRPALVRRGRALRAAVPSRCLAMDRRASGCRGRSRHHARSLEWARCRFGRANRQRAAWAGHWPGKSAALSWPGREFSPPARCAPVRPGLARPARARAAFELSPGGSPAPAARQFLRGRKTRHEHDPDSGRRASRRVGADAVAIDEPDRRTEAALVVRLTNRLTDAVSRWSVKGCLSPGLFEANRPLRSRRPPRPCYVPRKRLFAASRFVRRVMTRRLERASSATLPPRAVRRQLPRHHFSGTLISGASIILFRDYTKYNNQ